MEAYTNQLPMASDQLLEKYIEELNSWYNSLSADAQQETQFLTYRDRYANLAHEFQQNSDIKTKEACAAAVYQFCCLKGQQAGKDWADLDKVAHQFSIDPPRLTQLWKRLLKLSSKSQDAVVGGEN